MFKPLIFACLASACFAGELDREDKRHKRLAAQPTPHEWRAGAIWRFATTPPSGKSKPEVLTFRVTNEPATSCLWDVGWRNAWYKLVLVEGKIPSGAQPAYQVEGRAVAININADICDMNDYVDGVLTNGEFEGKRTVSGLLARSEVVGTV